MIIKESLYKIPVLKTFFSYINTVPINRSNLKEAIKSMDKAAEIMIEYKKNLLIAPEGTRRRKYSEQGQINMLPLKKGAFHIAKHTKTRIVPVIVVGAGRLMPLNTILIHPGTLYVKYCTPIEKDVVEKLEVDELLKLTEKTFHDQYFNIPNDKIYKTNVDNKLALCLFTALLVAEFIVLSLLFRC